MRSEKKLEKNMNHKEMFGDALWIGASREDVCPVIRKSFDVTGIRSAEIRILGFGSFTFYINGKSGTEDLFLPLVSDFEARDWPPNEELVHRAYPSCYDITHLLRDGKNTLAILLGNGWYTGVYKEKPFGTKKVCYSIRIETDKGTVMVYSDIEDRWRESFIQKSDLIYGEEHDYTDWDDQYLLPTYDDSAWEHAVLARPLETEYVFTDCPHDRVMSVIHPKLLWKKGNRAVYDLGKNTSVIPVLRATEGSDEIIFNGSEELLENGDLDPAFIHRQHHLSIRTGGKSVECSPLFTWYAARYFCIEGDAELLEMREVRSDVRATSDFACGNETLNWIYQTYLNTQLCNMHFGVPSDCPHLERRGYTGDGQLTCYASMMMTDSQRFYQKWIQDISDCQDRLTGHVQYTAPYTHSGGGPGGWGYAIVKVPYEYWKQYGDDCYVRELYPQMLHYFDYMESHSENDLVVRDREGEWCLGEWCTPGPVALPAPFINNYFYVKGMTLAIEIAKHIGKTEDIPMLEERIHIRKRAIEMAYFNSWDGNFIGNLQGANAFALDIGIGDERTKQNFIRYYDELGHYDTGIFGTDLVTKLLFEYGRGDIAYRLLTAESPWGFGKWKADGATTFWEYWYQSRSHNHPMFGAVTAYLFEHILGIQQSEGSYGYDDVRIQPCVLDGLNHANGSIETVKGKISVSYHQENKVMTLNVQIPKGVRATVVMPDGTEHPLAKKGSFSLSSTVKRTI